MTTNPTYKPSEGKREEFRRYLEKTGVMDALTKGLVSLYEEPDKPTDALQYLLNRLAIQSGGESFEDLKGQLHDAHEKITALEEENNHLKGAQHEQGGEIHAEEAPHALGDEPPHPEEAPPEEHHEAPA